MVSPLSSIVAGIQPPQNPGMQIGDMLRQQAITNSQLKTQGLQQQSIQQQMGQRQQALSAEQSLGAARYINQLGKQLLSAKEEEWPQILGPNLPQLQQLGYTPDILQNMTREQIEGVVRQTEPLMGTPGREQDSSTANIKDFEYYEQLKSKDPDAARMFAKDVGLLPKDKPLSATAEKALITSQDQFMKSSSESREYELLASDFERFKSELPVGSRATFGEFVKSIAGSQDKATELRRRFQAVRLSQALKNLPPGPATDKDVSEAMKGVPGENASVEQISSFLRGAAKVASIDAEFQEFKSEYISQNDSTKGLISAWKKAVEGGEIESVNQLGSKELNQEMPTPMTQADFDALPSGTIYIDPDDGKQYRKP